MTRITPTRPIVHLTMGRPSPLAEDPRVEGHDLYGLEVLDLSEVRALFIGMGIDEIHLGRHQPLLDSFVGMGGVLVACAQIARPYLTGLCRALPIDHRRPADLEVHAAQAHPVWEGVAAEDLTYRRGVAGFYGRTFYRDLPDGATVITTIGPSRLPLDFTYDLGKGTVLVHGGNDLWGWRSDENTSALLAPQLLEWATRAGGRR